MLTRTQVGLACLLCVMLAVPALGQAGRDFFRFVSPGASTITGFGADGIVTWSNAMVGATGRWQRAENLEGATGWGDYVQTPVTSSVMSLRLLAPDAPSGMVLIPAGSVQMGNAFSGEGYSGELPVHSVYVSAFYMDRTEVAKALWDEVYAWAIAHGYSFDNAGSGKAANHPVHTVNWYDTVKWSNARSEKAGLTACHTVGGVVYKTGRSAPDCDWSANGYRLPTEAEWEKAARGGASGRRFPWSDSDTIQHVRANYYSQSSYACDTSGTRGYHPDYNDGVSPYTSPVGSFAPNGYGLCDMAGNAWQWCWDWYDSAYYGVSPSSDPRGPSSGSHRVRRGASWVSDADGCRVAYRDLGNPDRRSNVMGFRLVRNAPQRAARRRTGCAVTLPREQAERGRPAP
jgi:formylglycine-generating enzyme